MSALLFVHGSGCTGEVFTAQLAAFENSSAPDLPAAGTSIGDLADFVESKIDGPVVIAGSSMGGAVALEIALRRIPQVRAIVLLGSGSRLRVAPAILEGLERDFEATALQLAKLMYADPTPDRIAATLWMMQRAGRARTLRDFRACNAFDVTDRLGGITVPVLALTGERDVLTPPKYAQALAGRVDGAQVRIIPDAGHLVMVERPSETNAAIKNFVDQVA